MLTAPLLEVHAMRRFTLGLLAGALALTSASAGAACPTNYASTGPYQFYPTEAVWRYFANPTIDGPSYDLIQGTMHSTWGACSEQTLSFYMTVHDDYWLEGPASATAIPFIVRMHVTGIAQGGTRPLPPYGCAYAEMSADLSSGALHDGVSANSFCTSVAVDRLLSVSVEHLPGEVFQVTMMLNTGGSCSFATADGVLTFEGVPPGYSIRSCQGYAAFPTPTRPTTWGNVKAAYR
jgi:hypothetical protein